MTGTCKNCWIRNWTLPDKYRAAIVLCDLEGITVVAAARKLGCPQGTLKARLVRGRAMLGKRLVRHGLAVSGGVLATALCQNAASACVPGPLVVSTVQAATLMAAGKAMATGAVSAKVVALMEGVLKAMLMTKLKITLAVVLAVNLIGAGVGLVYCQTAGSGQDKGGGPPAAQEKADKPVPTDQQPPPKKEVKEEAKAGQPIDYQKMAQEASWQPPENGYNPWTMCVMADGKKVYEWPLPAPFSVLRRFELGRVPCGLPPLGFRLSRSWLTTSRPENSCGGLNWRRPRRIILTEVTML